MRLSYKFGIFILFLILISMIAYYFHDDFNLLSIRTWLSAHQPWTPLLFIALYIIATVCFLPGSILTLAGGLLFGAWYGTLYNLIGATFGAMIAFLIARYLASDWVAVKGGKYINKILLGVQREGWRFVAFVRFVPLFPFNLTNYLFGITKINFIAYSITSFICMLPATFAYTYAGSLGEAFIRGQGFALIGKVIIAIGLLIFVSVLPIFIKRYRARTKQNDNAK